MQEKPGKRFGLSFGEVLAETKNQQAKEIFDRVLKGKLNKISPGLFPSEIPEIKSILITPVYPENGRPSINARINYINEDGKERNSTWSVFEDGVVSGKVPTDLKVAREDIALQILKTIERAGFDFWRKTEIDILPNSDETGPRPLSEEERKVIEQEKSNDSITRFERLNFLENQRGVLFGFLNERNGFRGYRGALFPTFILLENPEFGNAAYIVDLEKPIQVEKSVFEKPPAARINDKTFEKLLEEVWEPIAKNAKTRGELRQQFGAERIIHTPNTWREKLQQAIDRRLVSVESAAS